MQVLASLLSFFFVAIALAAMVFFGFVLLSWFIGVAAIMWLIFMVRVWYYRRFKLQPAPDPSVKIIDVEYKDITK